MLCLEPQVAPAEALAGRLAAAGLGEAVELRRLALAARAGRAELSCPEADPGAASLRRGAARGARREPVALQPLDALLPEAAPLAALWLDIAGAELAALEGAAQSLARTRPLIALRLSPGQPGTPFGYAPAELAGFLAAQGYTLYDALGFAAPEGPAEDAPGWHLALPDDRPLLAATVQGALDSALDRHGLIKVLA